MEMHENIYAPPKMIVTHHPCLTSDTEQAWETNKLLYRTGVYRLTQCLISHSVHTLGLDLILIICNISFVQFCSGSYALYCRFS